MKGFWVNIGTNYSAAFKYWMSPKTAVVAGVNIFGNGFISSSNQAQLPSSVATSVFGRFQYFLSERQRFMPYLTAGGNIGNTAYLSASNTSNALTVGLNGGIGMECFIMPWLSVAGELTLGGTYSFTRNESANPNINPNFYGGWTAGLANSGIIFTIYF